MSYKRKHRFKEEEGVYHYEHLSEWSNFYGGAVGTDPLSLHQQIDHQRVNRSDSFSFERSRLLKFTVGTLLGFSYFCYVSNLFESTTKFSLLSNLEREVSLPPEDAFRYSFFKQIGEAESFLKGFYSILNDKNDKGSRGHNVCPTTTSINPFKKYSLSPEVFHGATFHLLRNFEAWTNKRKFFNCQSSISSSREEESLGPLNSRLKTRTKDEHEVEKVLLENEKVRESCRVSSTSTSRFDNLFYFYIKSIWCIESLGIAILFHFGTKFSKSIFGGGVAVILFIVLHPQRSTAEWLFSFQYRIEWVAFLVQIYVVSTSVFKRSYPSWTTVVKVAVSTSLVILSSQKKSQWLLISQLIIITCMEIIGLANPYATSLLIFGQLTGWQYATMITLNISFAHCSLFLYTLTSCVFTIYVVQPTLEYYWDSTSITSLMKRWGTLLKLVFLLIAFQILFYTSLTCGESFLGIPHDDAVSSSMKSAINYSGKAEIERTFGHTSNYVTHSQDGERIRHNYNENVIIMPSEDANISKVLPVLFSSCRYPTFMHTWETFLNKYVLHLLIGIYAVIITFLLPSYQHYKAITAQLSPDGTVNRAHIGTAEEFTLPKMYNEKATACQDGSTSEETVHFSSYSNSSFSVSQLTPEFLIMKRNTSLITFNILQLSSFISFSIYFGKTWELLFISQLCLICSLFCDQKIIPLVFGHEKFNSRKGFLRNRLLIHWLMVFSIFLTLFARTKHGSSEMLQNSRAKFEVGNRRIQQLTETLQWIQQNTNVSDSCFIGLEIPLLYIHLTTDRSGCFQNNHFNDLLREFSSDYNSIWAKFNRNDKENEISVSSVLEKVYSMFSKTIPVQEYHNKLKSLNASHLFLSRNLCSRGQHSRSSSNGQEDQQFSSRSESTTSMFSFLWDMSKEEDIGINFKRNCDLTRLWNSVVSSSWSDPDRLTIRSSSTETKSKIKSSASSTLKGKTRFSKFKEPDRIPIAQEQSNNPEEPKIVDENVSETTEFKEDNDQSDILCLRLLNEPDVRPFKRVFENHDYTILAISKTDTEKKVKTKKKKSSNV